ncbi:MAG: iron chelate uptake ABC transporter family permease subunit [Mesorhizobium sp.]
MTRALRFFLPLSAVALVVASLAIGVDEASFSHGWTSPEALQLIFASRLPRTLAAVLAGAGLAIAGLVMQALARNRFVEPSTAGTAQGAAFGVLVATLLWPASPLIVKMLFAIASALAGTAIFLSIVNRLPPTQPYLVPLFGLVYAGVIGAGVTFIGWHWDLLQYVEIWMNGEFSGVLRGRYELLWIAALTMGLAWWVADRLTILSLGRDVSVSLGLSYEAMLRLGLVIVSIITALTVVVVGLIPFVGLVVPNLVTRFRGDDVRSAIPLVASVGAALVLACDLLGRTLRYPYEIPVGTVLGAVGAALFLLLLFWPRNG